MSDYTPTADHVRMVYAGINENRRAEFDRWLAEHDRKIKTEAYKRGYQDRAAERDYDPGGALDE